MKWLKNLFLKLYQLLVIESKPPTKPVEPPQEPGQPHTEPPVTKAPETPKEKVLPEPYNEIEVYEEALKLLIRFEGGYVNDPADPGGETNKGVTKRVYDEYRKSKELKPRSVKDITDKEVSDIYRTYWLEGQCDKLGSAPLALAHFDTCANAGVRQSSRFLQRTVGAKDDGIIGPITLGKVMDRIKKDGDLVPAKEFLERRREFHHNLVKQKPVSQKFLKGWLNRIAILEKYVESRN